MKILSIFFVTVLFSDLVYCCLLNEHLLQLSEMKEIDFKLVVMSAVLLDKDLNYIARLIRRAHDLGFRTRYLKGIVLDHLISINNDNKYHKFKELLREQKIYKNRDTKESLTCACSIKHDNVSLTNFISHKPSTLIVQWVELAKQLIKKDGQPIVTQCELNFISKYSQIFDFELPITDFLFEILLNIFEEISFENLKTFLAMYEQFINKIPKKYLFQMKINNSIEIIFLKKINDKNKEAAKMIFEFVLRVNPQTGLVGSTTSPFLKSNNDPELSTLVNRLNSKKVKKIYENFISVYSSYKKDQSQFVSVFEFLNRRFESLDCQVAHVKCCEPFFLSFIRKIRPNDENKNTDDDFSMFSELLPVMYKNENVYNEYFLTSRIITMLIQSEAWCQLLVTLDFMDAKGVDFKTVFYTFTGNNEFFQLPDEIMKKLYSILGKSRLKTYQKYYVFGVLSHSDINISEKFKIISSERLFDRFGEFLARSEIAELGNISFESDDLAKFNSARQLLKERNMLKSLDKRLVVEYFSCKINQKLDNTISYEEDFNGFLEYMAVIDVEKVEKINIDLTKDYVEKLMNMIDSKELCDCLSGIAARLATSGLYDHLRALFDVVCNLQDEPSEQHHDLLLSMLKRVSSAAVDVNSFQSLTMITEICKTMLAAERNGRGSCEQLLSSSDSLQNTSGRFGKVLSSIAKKATIFLIIYSPQYSCEGPLNIPTS